MHQSCWCSQAWAKSCMRWPYCQTTVRAVLCCTKKITVTLKLTFELVVGWKLQDDELHKLHKLHTSCTSCAQVAHNIWWVAHNIWWVAHNLWWVFYPRGGRLPTHWTLHAQNKTFYECEPKKQKQKTTKKLRKNGTTKTKPNTSVTKKKCSSGKSDWWGLCPALMPRTELVPIVTSWLLGTPRV